MPNFFIWYLGHDDIMLLRHDQHMSFCSRINIQNPDALLILIHFFCRHFTRDNLTEDTLLFLEFPQFLWRHMFDLFFQRFTLLIAYIRQKSEKERMFKKLRFQKLNILRVVIKTSRLVEKVVA